MGSQPARSRAAHGPLSYQPGQFARADADRNSQSATTAIGGESPIRPAKRGKTSSDSSIPEPQNFTIQHSDPATLALLQDMARKLGATVTALDHATATPQEAAWRR